MRKTVHKEVWFMMEIQVTVRQYAFCVLRTPETSIHIKSLSVVLLEVPSALE